MCAKAQRQEVMDHDGRDVSALELTWERTRRGGGGKIMMCLGFVPLFSSQHTSDVPLSLPSACPIVFGICLYSAPKIHHLLS